MQYTNLSSLTLQQIQLFLATAKYENFSLAAQQMYVAQSTVSKSISALENTLGLKLFDRTRHGVRLTPAGQKFEAGCNDIIYRLNQAVTQAYEAQASSVNYLHIGDMDSTFKDAYLTPICCKFLENHPDFNLRVEQYPVFELPDLMNLGVVDLSFTLLMEMRTLNSQNLCWQPLIVCPKSILVPRSHPLFSRDHVSVAELKNEHFIAISPTRQASCVTYITDMCGLYGFEPHISLYVPNVPSMLFNIKLGKGIGLSDKLMSVSDSDLKHVILDGFQGGVLMVWNRHAANPHVETFVREALELFGDPPLVTDPVLSGRGLPST